MYNDLKLLELKIIQDSLMAKRLPKLFFFMTFVSVGLSTFLQGSARPDGDGWTVLYQYSTSTLPNARGFAATSFPVFASLTRDGQVALISDLRKQKILSVDLARGTAKTLVSGRWSHAWLDVQTEEVFQLVFDDRQNSASRTIGWQDATAELHCFGSIAAISEGLPRWTRVVPNGSLSSVQWVEGLRVYVLARVDKSRKHSKLTVLDEKGDELAEFEISGEFFGADTSEMGLEIYHLAGPSGRARFHQSSVDSSTWRRGRSRSLYPMQMSHLAIVGNEGGAPRGNARQLRLRSLESDDFHRYLSKVITQPGFWDYNGFASPELLRPHLEAKSYRRISNLGQLAAAESPSAFEIQIVERSGLKAFAFNKSNYIPLASDYGDVVDAVQLGDRLVVATVKEERVDAKTFTTTCYILSHAIDGDASAGIP